MYAGVMTGNDSRDGQDDNDEDSRVSLSRNDLEIQLWPAHTQSVTVRTLSYNADGYLYQEKELRWLVEKTRGTRMDGDGILPVR